MPNYVRHNVRIKGTESDVQMVIASVCSEDGGIDFQKILPMPEELHKVTSPVRIISEEEYKKQQEGAELDAILKRGVDNDFRITGITEAIQKDYIKRFGSDNWYDWACANWGTKWNACDAQPPQMSTEDEFTVAILSFETAWSCPFPVLQKISENYPTVVVEVMYADEDWSANCGEFELRGGEITDENIPETGSREARRIATEMWGAMDDDEDEDEE